MEIPSNWNLVSLPSQPTNRKIKTLCWYYKTSKDFRRYYKLTTPVVVVVDTGNQYVRAVQIMRWWFSKLGHCPMFTYTLLLIFTL